MLAVSWVFACIVPNIGDIITIIGATTNPLVGFLFPILFYLKLHPEISSFKKAQAFFIIGITVISSICILILFVYDKFEEEK
jgi:amino acid permease